MTQEEKELLLKDLCARVPFGVKFILPGGNVNVIYTMIGIDLITTDEGVWDYSVTTKNTEPIEIKYIKPYLRPMSSMTEEEKKKLKEDTCPNGTGYFDEKYLICPMSHYGEQISYGFMSNILEWLNVHHFDYRHLIEKGLALKAPEDMYNV